MGWRLMGTWTVLSAMIMLTLLLLFGCAKEVPLPPVPAPPEDLSSWSVPELVQPPPPPELVPQAPKEKAPTSAEQILDFAPGTTFTLTVPVGAPLDIVLQRGEQVRNIIGGDRAPVEANQATAWEVKEGAEGIGETLRQHIFLTAAKAGMTTGLLVTTTTRVYYMTCKSVNKSPIRTVRWRYPVDPVVATPAKEPGLLPDPAQPKHYHVGYELASGHKTPPVWLPRHVVDDGKKTYIIYAEVALFDTVPMLRLIGPNGPQLVNARQYLNVVIVDQLVARGELRVGIGEHAETVTITRGTLKTIACPGDEACPVWPAAAQVLDRKSGGPRQPPKAETPAPPRAPTPVVPQTPAPAPAPQAAESLQDKVVPPLPQGDTP